MTSKIEKTVELAQTEGVETAFRFCLSYLGFRLFGRRLLSIEDICYQKWRRRNTPTEADFERMRAEVKRFDYSPLISVVMPVFDVDAAFLRRAVESVERQIYPNWELCIADDGSTRSETKAELERLSQVSDRIRIRFLEGNTGISCASNAAIELAGGEFIALLDHDDELSPDALFENVKLLNSHRDTDMIYSDEDKLDERGRHVEVFLKPDWSPELLLSNMYTCHLGVYRKSVIDVIGGFREGFEGAQDYDLVLRLTERTGRIRHIPRILYHWRHSPGSTASSYSGRGAGHSGMKAPAECSLKALREAMQRRGIDGRVEPGLFEGSYRVRPMVKDNPLVTIIIPTRDNLSLLEKCIRSVDENDYRNFEVIVVNNRSEKPETIEFLGRLASQKNTQVIAYDKPYDFSAINNLAANRARGSHLLLLNSDTEAVRPDWLTAMLEVAQIPGVAVVGSKLLYPDDTVQHAGIVLWHCGVAGHLHSRLHRDNHGYFGMADAMRNCSAVTAACMLIKKSIFDELGGLDPELPIAYQEVAFCLRAWECGYRTVYTPFSLLYHIESAVTGPRVDKPDSRVFQRKWENRCPSDPFYNPNFPRGSLNFRLR
ncbi:glycosyltransferase family 2 protein [Candidatus Poribacteria bacterium]|nr:glycosyltransferase family 2 protein [Candidatus Poribacteria bacterium]